MYKDLYKVPEPEIDIDTPKALVIVATIFLFFVIPVIGINYYKSQNTKDEIVANFSSNKNTKNEEVKNPTRSGTVAGASTDETLGINGTKNIYIPIIGNIEMDSKSGVLMVSGILMIAFSCIVFAFLLIDNKDYKFEENKITTYF